MSDLLHLGPRGEALAWNYLRKQGYQILEKNYRTRWGEIDGIAKKGDTMVFLEVKTRRDGRFGDPFESIDRRKREKLALLAEAYLQEQGREDVPARFDILSVTWDGLGEPEYALLEDAFMVGE